MVRVYFAPDEVGGSGQAQMTETQRKIRLLSDNLVDLTRGDASKKVPDFKDIGDLGLKRGRTAKDLTTPELGRDVLDSLKGIKEKDVLLKLGIDKPTLDKAMEACARIRDGTPANDADYLIALTLFAAIKMNFEDPSKLKAAELIATIALGSVKERPPLQSATVKLPPPASQLVPKPVVLEEAPVVPKQEEETAFKIPVPAGLDISMEPYSTGWRVLNENFGKMKEDDKKLLIRMIIEHPEWIVGIFKEAILTNHGGRHAADKIMERFENFKEEQRGTSSFEVDQSAMSPALVKEFMATPSSMNAARVKDRLDYLFFLTEELNKELVADGTKEGRKTEIRAGLKKIGDELKSAEKEMAPLGAEGRDAIEKWNWLMGINTSVENLFMQGRLTEIADRYFTGRKEPAITEGMQKYLSNTLDAIGKTTGMLSDTVAGKSREEIRAMLYRDQVTYDEMARKGGTEWRAHYSSAALGINQNLQGNENAELRGQFARVSELDYVAYAAFGETASTLRLYGLDTEPVTLLMIQTISDLNVANKMLLPAYFNAVTNLARLCRGDKDLFLKAMMNMTFTVNANLNPETMRKSNVNVLGMQAFMLHYLRAVSNISPAAVSVYNYEDLGSEYTFQNPYSPYEWRTRSRFTSDGQIFPRSTLLGIPVTSPFINIYPNQPMYGGTLGAIGGGYHQDVSILRPNVQNVSHVNPGALQWTQTTKLYLDPRMDVDNVLEYFPNADINMTSENRLMRLMALAAVPTTRQKLSDASEVRGGRLAFSGGGSKIGTEMQQTYIGTGDLVSDTGGKYLGYSENTLSIKTSEITTSQDGTETTKVETESTATQRFAGGAWVGERVGHVDVNNMAIAFNQIKTPGADDKINAAFQQSLQAWKDTHEGQMPTQVIIVGNFSQVDENNRTGAGAIVVVDLATQSVYEIRAQGSTLQGLANALLLQANSSEKALVSANLYGPKLWGMGDRVDAEGNPLGDNLGGGGLVTFNAGEVPLLAMGQAVPGSKGERMFYEWVAAGAAAPTKTSRIIVGLPGTIAGETGGELVFQSADVIYKKIVDPRSGTAWQMEVTAGGGLNTDGTPTGAAAVRFRYQKPQLDVRDASKRTPTYAGFGVSYYGSENMTNTLLIQDEQNILNQVQSIKRVVANVYGSGPVSETLMLGALLNMVEQFKSEGESTSHDLVLYRFAFFLKSLKDEGLLSPKWAMSFGASRFSNLDTLLEGENFSTLRSAMMGGSPEEIERANQNLGNVLKQLDEVYKEFSFGVRVEAKGTQFGLQLYVIGKEKERDFLSWSTEVAGGRAIARITSDKTDLEGFVRIQTVLNNNTPTNVFNNNVATGFASIGGGGTLHHGKVFDKVATDLMVFASLMDGEAKYEGLGWTGAARVYHNYLDIHLKYKKELGRKNLYMLAIETGKIGSLPASVKAALGLDATEQNLFANLVRDLNAHREAITRGDVKALPAEVRTAIGYTQLVEGRVADLNAAHEKYKAAINEGRMSDVPADVWKAIGMEAPKKKLGDAQVKDILKKLDEKWYRAELGKAEELTTPQLEGFKGRLEKEWYVAQESKLKRDAVTALEQKWWYPEVANPLEKEFNGNVAVYFDWALYFPKNKFGRIDLGLIVDIVDKGALYVLGSYDNGTIAITANEEDAKRERLTFYAGFEFAAVRTSKATLNLSGVLGAKVMEDGKKTFQATGGLGLEVETRKYGEYGVFFTVNNPNVPDFMTPGFPGISPNMDFLQWQLMLTWTYRFGGPKAGNQGSVLPDVTNPLNQGGGSGFGR